MKIIKKISLILVLIIAGCKNMESEHKKHYIKKYSTLVVSDIALGYTCKTLLAFGVLVCASADIIADIAVVSYHNKKFYKAQEEKKQKLQETGIIDNTISNEKNRIWNFKETMIDIGMFVLVLLLLP